MGVSDPAYFDWLRGSLRRFEQESGRLGEIGRAAPRPVLWGLGGQRLDPAVEVLRDALGPATDVVFLDKFPRTPGVVAQDLNALETLPDAACDVLTLFRASMFISRPEAFLAEASRVLRPAGLLLVDWLHGLSDAPVLDLRGEPRYDGVATPFTTTYVDRSSLELGAPAFQELIAHVNRPPAWVNLATPGVTVPLRQRLTRLLGRRPRREVTLSTYIDTLRRDLTAAGKRLVEPALLDRYFDVLYRDAAYLYRTTGKFNLYLLTALAAKPRPSVPSARGPGVAALAERTAS